MDIDHNKIAIIIHKKSDTYFSALLNSLSQLKVPDGFSVDILAYEASSAPFVYNASQSNAKYKLYIDEEVRILRHDFLFELTEIFQSDKDIAAVGVEGAEVILSDGTPRRMKRKSNSLYESALALEGYFIATQYEFELPWREEFMSPAFIGAAKCLELKKKGFKCVVATQKNGDWVCGKNIIADNERVSFVKSYAADFLPLVSVIIPTYNRPKLFQAALDSVLAQTYPNLDIFITDNSPGTETKEMMRSYSDERITYEHHPEFDAGANWDRAMGYNNPEAEYVNWLMDDDLWHSEKIARMMDFFLSEDGLSLVTSHRKLIDENENELFIENNASISPVNSTTRIEGKTAGKRLLLTMSNYIGEPSTVLIKKSCLRNNTFGWRGDEGDCLISDFPTWLQLLTKGDMVYITDQLSSFRLHESQDGANPITIAKGLVCWEMMMEHAWKTGCFFDSIDEYKAAVLLWLHHWPNCLTQDFVINNLNNHFVKKFLTSLSKMASIMTS